MENQKYDKSIRGIRKAAPEVELQGRQEKIELSIL